MVYLQVCIYFLWINKDWRYLCIPALGFSIFGAILLVFEPETPRFYASVHRYDEAREVLKLIAKKNGKENLDFEETVFKDEVDRIKSSNVFYRASNEIAIEERGSIKEFWRDRLMRKNLFFSNIIWCANITNYYLIAFYIKYFPGSMFVNSIALGSSDVLSYALAGLLLRKTNTRVCLMISFVVSIIGATTY